MEQLIIIALLIIIILILWDRSFPNLRQHEPKTETKLHPPSIMGGTKKQERRLEPIDSNKSQYDSALLKVHNFNSETKSEIFDNVHLKKNLDDCSVKNNNWEEEEEEWQYQNDSLVESGFATGVSFQELSTVGQLLQQKSLESALEQQAVTIIQKIEGTELFDLLENSLGDASKRIASLLSESISNDQESSSSNRQSDAEGFDIGEFV